MSLLDPSPEADDVVVNLANGVDPLLSQWSRWRDAFASAMGDGFWSLEDLEQRIAHRRAFFFPGKAAAVVAQIEAYPGGKKVLQSLWAVGDVEEVALMVPGIEAVARMMGCDGVMVEGRKAWERVLRGQGYEPWSVTLYKEL